MLILFYSPPPFELFSLIPRHIATRTHTFVVSFEISRNNKHLILLKLYQKVNSRFAVAMNGGRTQICKTRISKQCCWRQSEKTTQWGKLHLIILHVQTEFCQIAFQPPPPSIKQTDALWQVFFAENEQILKHSVLYFGNGYLDNNYGQTWFLDGILM